MMRPSLSDQRRTHPNRRALRAFAISEMILTVTTASIVIGTALTSLTVYMSVTDERKSIQAADGLDAAVLPAEELSMETTLFHLEFQRLIHEADLCYVIGGARFAPGSEGTANLIFTPPLDDSSLRILDELESVGHAPDRALSSYVMTQLLAGTLPDSFSATSEDLANYEKRAFTVLTVKSDQSVTGVVTHRVTVEESWVILDATLYQPAGNAWSKSNAYRCAVLKETYDGLTDSLSFGASHYWVRHDRLNPVTAESTNSLWNRYEEGFCRVEFFDNTWNLPNQPANTPLTSKFTYFIPVVK